MPGSVQYPAIDIRHEMEVVQGIFNIGMPHIPHKVRKHGIHVFSFPQPAVHVGIDKVMAEIIRVYADTGTSLFRKSGIPDTQEVLLQPPCAVWKVLSVREESHALREQETDPAVIHAIGVPDQYILQRRGWAGGNAMKAIYRNAINIETVRQDKKSTNISTKQHVISCDISCDTLPYFTRINVYSKYTYIYLKIP